MITASISNRPTRLPRRVICLRLTVLVVLLFAATAGAEEPPLVAWDHIWNGPANSDDHGRLAAFDPAGTLYVAGTTYESGIGANRRDYFVQQFDPAGNLAWTRYYGAEGNDEPSGLLVTSSGDVVVTGLALEDTLVTVTTISYDPAGTVLWSTSFPLVDSNWLNFPPQLTSDADGNLLIGATSDNNFLVLKYSPVGTLLWDRAYAGPAGGMDLSTGIATAAGNVYVTGIAYGDGGGDNAIATVKFDASGTFQWEQFESGDIGSAFTAVGVAVAPDGNVVVVGNTESVCGVFQVRTWKLNATTGTAMWVETFPDEPCKSVEAVDMAIADGGDVVVAGYGAVDGPTIHFHTLRYGPDGQSRWHRAFDGVGTSSDVAAALTLDDADNAYVVGLTTFPPQDRDLTAVKYTSVGDEAWSVHWAGPSGTNDGAVDVVVAASGDVALVGHTFFPTELENAVTIVYRQLDIAAATPMPVGEGPLARALPNPFTHKTAFRYRLGRPGAVRLAVYDVRGHRVRLLHDGFAPSGDHNLTWHGNDDQGRALPSGTYIMRLESARGSASVRVGLVR